ncbi:MAG TPA: PAS and ANTAR domain-containing protein [Nocardioidaceae bacterium]|nr:PAS and ANTAR domain-containing protein [Nocardioidaceae bacterium]
MTITKLEPSGAFDFVPGSQTWTWSPQTYRIYGFAPGDVVPSTELLLAHQHPEDRVGFVAFLEDVLRGGEAGSLWHRILDASGAVRRVMTTAMPLSADGGRTGVRGHVVDVTEAVRQVTAQEVDQALETIARSRPLIDQAKGAVMADYALDADQAFRVLRGYSQLCNVKVRDVARSIVEAMAGGEGLAPESRRLLDRLAAQARGGVPHEPCRGQSSPVTERIHSTKGRAARQSERTAASSSGSWIMGANP